jgi:transposase
MHAEGHSLMEIARVWGRGYDIIHERIKRFMSDIPLGKKKGQGRKRKTSPQDD